jgi:hypothetical protein
MKTFQEYISEAARLHGGVNLVFEHGMYALIDDLDRIVTVLRDAGIAFEVIGGVAVNAHILGVCRSRSFVTSNVDVLVHRHDLQKIVSTAESANYTGRSIVKGSHRATRPPGSSRRAGGKRPSGRPLGGPAKKSRPGEERVPKGDPFGTVDRTKSQKLRLACCGAKNE